MRFSCLPMTKSIVDIRCPSCSRWLSEARDYGRSVCPNCGWEVTVRSKRERGEVLTVNKDSGKSIGS